MGDWTFYALLGITCVLLQVAGEAILDEWRNRRWGDRLDRYHARERRRAQIARALIAGDTSAYEQMESLNRVPHSTEVEW